MVSNAALRSNGIGPRIYIVFTGKKSRCLFFCSCSVRKGRGTRAPPGPPEKNQVSLSGNAGGSNLCLKNHVHCLQQMEASSLSAVDQASFFEGLEQNDSESSSTELRNQRLY